MCAFGIRFRRVREKETERGREKKKRRARNHAGRTRPRALLSNFGIVSVFRPPRRRRAARDTPPRPLRRARAPHKHANIKKKKKRIILLLVLLYRIVSSNVYLYFITMSYCVESRASSAHPYVDARNTIHIALYSDNNCNATIYRNNANNVFYRLITARIARVPV